MIEQDEGRLRVSAPMVITNARALLAAGRACLLSGASAGRPAVLDLSAVSEVDSSALGVVLAWLRTGRARGIALLIANPPANLISLATLYGVSELLPLA